MSKERILKAKYKHQVVTNEQLSHMNESITIIISNRFVAVAFVHHVAKPFHLIWIRILKFICTYNKSINEKKPQTFTACCVCIKLKQQKKQHTIYTKNWHSNVQKATLTVGVLYSLSIEWFIAAKLLQWFMSSLKMTHWHVTNEY